MSCQCTHIYNYLLFVYHRSHVTRLKKKPYSVWLEALVKYLRIIFETEVNEASGHSEASCYIASSTDVYVKFAKTWLAMGIDGYNYTLAIIAIKWGV